MIQDPNRSTCKGGFVFSLDFELMWGVRDKRTIADYGENILGVRQAVPRILDMFAEHEISATWATVGLLFFDDKDAMIAGLPTVKPDYKDINLSAYGALSSIGENEKSDPYHFAPSLIQRISETPGQEIGSHSFSHIYSLATGMTNDAFKSDLDAAIAVASTRDITLQSYVFPRNQVHSDHVEICKSAGLTVYRGTEVSKIYTPDDGGVFSQVKRAGRLTDTYLNMTGHNGFRPSVHNGAVNTPSSRFLRPYSPRLAMLEPIRVERILKAMKSCAKEGMFFHVWTHPHNFGIHLEENLAALHAVISMAKQLNIEYDWPSYSMAEAAKIFTKRINFM